MCSAAVEAPVAVGGFTLLRRAPAPDLHPWVLDVEGFEDASGVPSLQRQVPTGFVPLIIVFGHGFQNYAADGTLLRDLSGSFLAGVHESAALVGSRGTSKCMQVNLTPVGAWRLLGIDMHELNDHVWPMDELLGPEVHQLEQQLEAACDWASRFDLVEELLRRRLQRALLPNPLVVESLHWMQSRPHAIRVDDLTRHLGCSRKHLAGLFRREVGLTPKAFARVLRFDAAVRGLEGGSYGSLTDAASASGYADQAHFSRECQRLAGCAPGELFAGPNDWREPAAEGRG